MNSASVSAGAIGDGAALIRDLGRAVADGSGLNKRAFGQLNIWPRPTAGKAFW
jgi:hypothetical protein